MRHACTGRQFGRDSSHRKALLRMLVTALLKNEKIETTVAKAKEIRPLAEKMITLGKRGDLHARRQALSFINDETVVSGLFTSIAPRFASRNGGYT
jgi:large subunit ribosomal protein L17